MADVTEKIKGGANGGSVHAFRRLDPRALDAASLPFVPLDLSSVFGRDSRSSAYVLDDPSVSRQHLLVRFSPRRRRFEVVDLDSANGLFVNGRRVSEHPIAVNDVLRAGNQLLVFVGLSGVADRFEHRLGDEAFDGVSDAIRQANAILASAPRGSRILLTGEPGVGKAEAVRRLASRPDASRRLVALHGTSMREPAWEAHLLRALDDAGSAHDVIVHFDDLALAPREALERVEFLLRGSALLEGGRASVVATVSCAAGPVARGGLTPGLAALLGPPHVHVPPLRTRRDDVGPAFSAALRRRGRRSPPVASALFAEALLLHSWPGNVAEVRALVDLLAAADRLEADFDVADLPGRLLPGAELVLDLTHDAAKVVDALRVAEGNVSDAARRLGVSRRHLYRLIERHALAPATWRSGPR